MNRKSRSSSIPAGVQAIRYAEKVIILPVEERAVGPDIRICFVKSDLVQFMESRFDHKGETPGLGAEINTTPFESMFEGKQLFENGNFVSIMVEKGGADPGDLHGVDAISGGTITSKGLQNMLFDCIRKYNDYFTKTRN
jgi:Na+-transporting NADH:ubiquinone oxidoreductase subunit C